MNIDNLKNKKRHIPKALLYLSGLLALLIGAKVSAFVINSNQIPENIALALNSPGRSEENIKKYQLKYTEATDALKKKNLFMPPVAQKQNPISQVTAVLGDEVCISDKWYKVGDKVSDAQITGITPNEVTILWNETESKLKPFDMVILAEPPKPTNDDNNKDKSDKKDKKENKQEQPERVEENRPMGRPQFSDEERQKRMQEYMNNLSPEDRARMQERMRSRGGPGGGGSRGGSDRGSRGPGGRMGR
ncbi:MAG: hypothetical protein K9M75_07480 [Phycisphaerae bacterium]|nr:hypothetical protein [Phycisphaerae bacterium]